MPDAGLRTESCRLQGSRFVRKSTCDTGGGEVDAERHAKPAESGKPCWTPPYVNAEGAETRLVTCSVPVCSRAP